MSEDAGGYRFQEGPPVAGPSRALVAQGAGGLSIRFAIQGRLEIGRDDGARPREAGLLLVPDATVSRRHCVITRRPDGRCMVVDTSRNGTRIDGRRLAPNVEAELRVGHTLAVGEHWSFVLQGEPAAAPAEGGGSGSTVPKADRTVATVLVGDIRDYTVLVRTALSEELQRSVGRVFEALAAAVVELGGAVKEAQGDSLLAWWEGDFDGRMAPRACRAALELDALARRLAADRAAWSVPGAGLHMDWALATGLVLIDSLGRSGAMGLSMMGEPVVRAYRIEKYADDQAGRIVACPATRELAAERFEFRDLGERAAKGFDRPDHVYALVRER